MRPWILIAIVLLGLLLRAIFRETQQPKKRPVKKARDNPDEGPPRQDVPPASVRPASSRRRQPPPVPRDVPVATPLAQPVQAEAFPPLGVAILPSADDKRMPSI